MRTAEASGRRCGCAFHGRPGTKNSPETSPDVGMVAGGKDPYGISVQLRRKCRNGDPRLTSLLRARRWWGEEVTDASRVTGESLTDCADPTTEPPDRIVEE